MMDEKPIVSGGRGFGQFERDAALRRVVRARRWVIGAAAALTAAVAALVSAIAPGRSSGAQRTRAPSTGSVTSPTSGALGAPRLPPLESASQLGLQGPGEAPAPATPAPATPGPEQSAPSSSASSAQAPTPAPALAPAPVSGGS